MYSALGKIFVVNDGVSFVHLVARPSRPADITKVSVFRSMANAELERTLPRFKELRSCALGTIFEYQSHTRIKRPELKRCLRKRESACSCGLRQKLVHRERWLAKVRKQRLSRQDHIEEQTSVVGCRRAGKAWRFFELF